MKVASSSNFANVNNNGNANNNSASNTNNYVRPRFRVVYLTRYALSAEGLTVSPVKCG